MKKINEDYQNVVGRLLPKNPNLKKDDLGTKNITFQVTDDCNLCCTYCYQIHKQHHAMPFEVAKEFIEMILEKGNENTNKYIDSWNSTAVIIEFIGGEPFLQIDLIDQISDYFVRRLIELQHPWAEHYRISICSNGLLYFDPKVQAYIKKHSRELSFSISIDGNKELHDACRIQKNGLGSYDIAMAGVRHYIDVLGGEMGSKMTLAPENIGYTYEAVKSLIENGYREINLNCVYEEGWTEEHAKILYQQLKLIADYIIENNLFEEVYLSIFTENFFRPKLEGDDRNWCGGNGAMIAVDYKGDIYPCLRYMESSLGEDQKPLIIGNIYTGILATEEQCTCNDCLKCDRRSQSTDECYYCPIAEGCSWCSAYNYQKFGTLNHRATFICIMHKARALANAYFWNLGYIMSGSNKRMKIYLPDEESLKIISREELDYLHWLENHPVMKETIENAD